MFNASCFGAGFITYLFRMIAPSSMMHPDPITIGPPAANIVTFGCTIVPAAKMNKTKAYAGGANHTCTNSNITLHLYILTHDSFRMDGILVTASGTFEQLCSTTVVEHTREASSFLGYRFTIKADIRL